MTPSYDAQLILPFPLSATQLALPGVGLPRVHVVIGSLNTSAYMALSVHEQNINESDRLCSHS